RDVLAESAHRQEVAATEAVGVVAVTMRRTALRTGRGGRCGGRGEVAVVEGHVLVLVVRVSHPPTLAALAAFSVLVHTLKTTKCPRLPAVPEAGGGVSCSGSRRGGWSGRRCRRGTRTGGRSIVGRRGVCPSSGRRGRTTGGSRASSP